MPGFCVWCGNGKAAWGRGFWGLVKISRVAGLGGFTGCEFVMALPGHFHLAWRGHPTFVRALGLHTFELPCSGDCSPGALECRLSLCCCDFTFKRAAFTFSIGAFIYIVAPLSTAALHEIEYAPVDKSRVVPIVVCGALRPGDFRDPKLVAGDIREAKRVSTRVVPEKEPDISGIVI